MFNILCRESRRFFALVVLVVSGCFMLAPAVLFAAQSTATVTVSYTPVGTRISSVALQLQNSPEEFIVVAKALNAATGPSLPVTTNPTSANTTVVDVGYIKSGGFTTDANPFIQFDYNLTSCTVPTFTVNYDKTFSYYDAGTGQLIPFTPDNLTLAVSTDIKHNNLDLSFAGGGGGTVTSTPILVSTLAGGAFPFCTPLTLHASANAYSLFTGWTGSGCSGTGTCVVPLSNDGVSTSVTATFIPAGARLLNPSSSLYADLLTAYNAAAVGPVTIQARDIPFTGGLDLNRNLSLKLQGGFNSDYSSNGGYTEIRGTLIVRNEVLTAENIVISQ
jgi:hypothetical protein